MRYGGLINFDEVNRGSKSISVRTTVADYSLLKINFGRVNFLQGVIL